MSESKKVIKYAGTVVGKPLIIGTKKPKKIGVGKKFETTNKALFDSLIQQLKIK